MDEQAEADPTRANPTPAIVSNEPEEKSNRLQTSVGWLQGEVRGILEKREDGQRNLDHLMAVRGNTILILENLTRRSLTEEERLKIELFVWGHDWGKWATQEVEESYKTEGGKRILKALGLKDEEESILDKGVNGNNFRKDIAHHLYSAFLFEKASQAGSINLDPQDKKVILDAILAHQFGDYYRYRMGLEKGYSSQEIEAIRRPIKYEKAPDSSDFAVLLKAAANDGDKLSMVQLGEIDQEGNFHLGGYGKIFMISVGMLVNGTNPNLTSLDHCFDSANKSVIGVGQELATAKGREIYLQIFGKVGELKNLFFSRYEEMSKRAIPNTAADQKESLMKEIDIAIRQVSQELIKS